MEVCEQKDVHPKKTPRGYTYCFTPKHHYVGKAPRKGFRPSRWRRDMPRDDEFQVFYMADDNRLEDGDGNLFGLHIVKREGASYLEPLGEWSELLARFFLEAGNTHWHGHPVWPVEDSPERCPGAQVFERMVELNLLSRTQADRLERGRHVRNLGALPDGH
jgi:hypothetical protein